MARFDRSFSGSPSKPRKTKIVESVFLGSSIRLSYQAPGTGQSPGLRHYAREQEDCASARLPQVPWWPPRQIQVGTGDVPSIPNDVDNPREGKELWKATKIAQQARRLIDPIRLLCPATVEGKEPIHVFSCQPINIFLRQRSRLKSFEPPIRFAFEFLPPVVNA